MSLSAAALLGVLGLVATTHPWSSHTIDQSAQGRGPNVVRPARPALGQLEGFPRELCDQSARTLAVYLAEANDPARARSVLSINFGHVCPDQEFKVNQAWHLARAAADSLR